MQYFAILLQYNTIETIAGEKIVAAMVKELKLLDTGAMKDKPVVVPIHPFKLTEFEKRAALDIVNINN